ncbi:MAG: hypothetical protein ABJA78_10775 [Ferruginibacter sp.]
MKRLYMLAAGLFIAALTFGQARNATAEYNKQIKPAVAIEIPFSEKTVGNAIEDKMTRMGYKSSNSKGFMVYKSVRLSELGSGSYDLYYDISRVSKKDKGTTTVTLMLSTGFESFIGDTTDATVMDNAKTYLNGLKDMVAAYDLEQQITEQEDVVKKADKKYNNLVDDANDLQKKKRKIEEDIEKNIKDQKSQQDEQTKQKQVLNTLRGQRKA